MPSKTCRRYLLLTALLCLHMVGVASSSGSLHAAFATPLLLENYRGPQRCHGHRSICTSKTMRQRSPPSVATAKTGTSTTSLFLHSRRDCLSSAASAAMMVVTTGVFTLSTPSNAVSTAVADFSPTTSIQPLADMPMVRLKLPKDAFGREYVVIKLDIQGQGPFEFMVDSGLTTEMITPHLRDLLLRSSDSKTDTSMTITGLGAGGASENPLVELKGASLVSNDDKSGNLSLSSPLHAIVTDFPQEHIDPEHNVEGMIGMEVLEQYDVDFDFPNGRIRFWPPREFGQRGGMGEEQKLIGIPAAVLNESRLEGIRLRSISPQQKIAQPMLGIIDCGASFSTINLAAAELLGLDVTTLRKGKGTPSVVGIGIDGRKMVLPTTPVQFTFAGNAVKDANGKVRFEEPPPNFTPWDPVSVAVGDLPVFSQLLGDSKNPLRVPVVLLGLDILSQRQIVLETGKGRSRRMFVSPS